MQSCEQVRSQLLPMLYKLIGDDEQQKIQHHVETCAECRAALEQANTQQDLLAEAAKQEFVDVTFAPPATTEKMRANEETQVFHKPHSRRWTRWALAASLLVIFGIGAIIGVSGMAARLNHLAHAQQKLAKTKHDRDKTEVEIKSEKQRIEDEMRAIHKQIDKITTDWKKETKRVVEKQKVRLSLSGPKNLQAGVRNVYRINVEDIKRKSRPQLLEVKLVNPKTGKQLFAQNVKNQTQVQVDLPPELPIGPGADLEFVVTTKLDDGKSVEITESMPVVAPLYLTHLSTDRPLYRPGDTVYFRSLTLERFALKPPSEDLQIQFEILGPDKNTVVYRLTNSDQVAKTKDGQPIVGPDGNPIRGIGAGSYRISPTDKGGVFTVVVSEAQNRFPKQTREISVLKYKPPIFNKELEFTRKSYGPGETVVANGSASRAEGGGVAKKAIAEAIIDGKTVFGPKEYACNAEGKVQVKFQLPKTINKGEGTLVVNFIDGKSEPIRETIPIVTNQLHVEFFPEGGELVAGVPNRVYFQVRSTLGKPADLYGRLVDQNGNTVVKVHTLTDDKKAGVNQGMGRFEFVPKSGATYQLKVNSPVNVTAVGKFPKVKNSGVVLSVPKDVIDSEIPVVLRSTQKKRKLFVGAYCRGRMLSSKEITVNPGTIVNFPLQTAPQVGGVYRITVFEYRQDGSPLLPVAERLVYRRAVEKVGITLTPDRQKDKHGNIVYYPGSPVTVGVKTTDEEQKEKPAILLVSVVDLSIVKLAREKTARSMPVHFYLTSEIRRPEELEYADFIVSDHPKAERALDLLLGTQGWRRFAEVKPAEFVKEHRKDAEKFLAENGIDRPNANPGKTIINNKLALAKVDQQFGVKFVTQQATLAKKEAKKLELQTKGPQKLAALSVAVRKANHNASETERKYKAFVATLVRSGLAGLAVVLIVVAGGMLIYGCVKRSREQGNYTGTIIGGASLLTAGGVAAIVFLALTISSNLPLAQREGQVALNAKQRPQFDAMPGGGDDLANMAAPKAEMAPAGGIKLPMAPNPGQAMPPRANPNVPPGLPIERPDPKNMVMRPKPQAPMQDAAPPGGAPEAPVAGAAPMPMPNRPGDPMVGFGPPPIGGAGFGGARPGGRVWVRDEVLRKQGNFQTLALKHIGRPCMLPPPVTPFVVREYTHTHKKDPKGFRIDFAQTLYWQPVLVTRDGKAEFAFELPDSITRFQIVAMAHTTDGRLGAKKIEIASRLPYSLTPTEPVEVSHTDKITLPVLAKNDTGKQQSLDLSIETKNLDLLGSDKQTAAVKHGTPLTKYFQLRPSIVQGKAKIFLTGKFGKAGTDKIVKTFDIVPDGFPIVSSKSDLLEGVAKHIIELPDSKSLIDGTLKCQVQVFPSTLANLQKGLDGLLRQPSGCFEQSSSSNYPNVLISQYMQETDQNSPTIVNRAKQLMQNGYGRLVSYECKLPSDGSKKRGYEWFGGTAPPHEALTAYGLLQFRDMAKVYPVDEDMIKRTEQYLLSQRKPEGGFKRNPRALDSFGRAPDHITDAYIVWALTESGTKADLSNELDLMTKKAADSKDAYYLALVGLSQINTNRTKDGVATLKRLIGLQKDDGHLEGETTSITGSRGRNLQIETTALSVFGWLKANRPGDFQQPIEKSVKWIGKQRGGYGGFGATQSTILALKALVAYAKANKRTAEAGELHVYVGDSKTPAGSVVFEAGAQGPLTVDVPAALLEAGKKNVIKVEISGKNHFPHTLSWEYRTIKPVNPDNCPVTVKTTLNKGKVKESDLVQVNVKVKNQSGKGQGMAVAIIGLPGGLSLPADLRQLKDLTKPRDNGTKAPKVSYFELRGRELVLYWRSMAPDQEIDVTFDLFCRVPGEYRGPASRAYLYYDSDNVFWTDPLAVKIAPAVK